MDLNMDSSGVITRPSDYEFIITLNNIKQESSCEELEYAEKRIQNNSGNELDLKREPPVWCHNPHDSYSSDENSEYRYSLEDGTCIKFNWKNKTDSCSGPSEYIHFNNEGGITQNDSEIRLNLKSETDVDFGANEKSHFDACDGTQKDYEMTLSLENNAYINHHVCPGPGFDQAVENIGNNCEKLKSKLKREVDCSKSEEWAIESGLKVEYNRNHVDNTSEVLSTEWNLCFDEVVYGGKHLSGEEFKDAADLKMDTVLIDRVVTSKSERTSSKYPKPNDGQCGSYEGIHKYLYENFLKEGKDCDTDCSRCRRRYNRSLSKPELKQTSKRKATGNSRKHYRCIVCSKRTKPGQWRRISHGLRQYLNGNHHIQVKADDVTCNSCRCRYYRLLHKPEAIDLSSSFKDVSVSYNGSDGTYRKHYNCVLCSKRTEPKYRRRISNEGLLQYLCKRFSIEVKDDDVICNRCRVRYCKSVAKPELKDTSVTLERNAVDVSDTGHDDIITCASQMIPESKPRSVQPRNGTYRKHYSCVLCSKKTEAKNRRRISNEGLHQYLYERYCIEVKDDGVICNRCRCEYYRSVPKPGSKEASAALNRNTSVTSRQDHNDVAKDDLMGQVIDSQTTISLDSIGQVNSSKTLAHASCESRKTTKGPCLNKNIVESVMCLNLPPSGASALRNIQPHSTAACTTVENCTQSNTVDNECKQFYGQREKTEYDKKQNVVNDILTFSCKPCQISFKVLSELQKHDEMMHCISFDTCDRVFNSGQLLQEPRYLMHEDLEHDKESKTFKYNFGSYYTETSECKWTEPEMAPVYGK